MATSTLQCDRRWKGFQSVTGTTIIDITNLDYQELFIKVVVAGGTNMASVFLPKTTILTSGEYHRMGGWQTDANSELVVVSVSTTQVQLISAFLNGSTYTSNARVSVYYR